MSAKHAQRRGATALTALAFLSTTPSGQSHFIPRATGHCIQWKPAELAETTWQPLAGTPSGQLLCRPQPEGQFAPHTQFEFIPYKTQSLPVGIYDSATRQCLVNGKLVAHGIVAELAFTDPSCDVWWRTVTSDVMPPMTEMAMHFGSSAALPAVEAAPATSADSDDAMLTPLYGICRSLDENPELGTLLLNGDNVGHCIIHSSGKSTPRVIVGGGYDIIQAREGNSGGCENDADEAKQLSASLSAKVEKFISAEDRRLIEEVTGYSFSELADEAYALGSCELRQVLSSVRFIPHDLNTKGLTLMRHVLAERMYDQRQEDHGSMVRVPVAFCLGLRHST